MSSKENNNDLIQNFINGKLDKTGLKIFYKKFDEDKTFADDVVSEISTILGRKDLKKRLQTLYYKTNKKPEKQLLHIFKIAAFILLIIGIGILFNYYFSGNEPDIITQTPDTVKTTPINKQLIETPVRQPKEPDKPFIKKKKPTVNKQIEKTGYIAEHKVENKTPGIIANEYFTASEMVTTRGNQNHVEQAISYYINKEYDSAIVIFEKLLLEQSNNDRIEFILFYLANSYMALSVTENDTYKLNKAGEYFNFLVEDGNNKYVNQSEWYLAIYYLKTEETEKCINILNKIVQNQSYNYKKAITLLEDVTSEE